MIIAAAKRSFERLSMFTLLSLCVSGIVGRKLSAYIYGSARTGRAPRISREDLDFRSIGQSATILERGEPISRGDLFNAPADRGVIIASETEQK
jgi:hypothetical protein